MGSRCRSAPRSAPAPASPKSAGSAAPVDDDLAEAERARDVAAAAEKQAAGVAHEIRVGSHELPALWDTEDEPIEALTGVESEDGLPVLAARPWIDVPPLPAGTRPWNPRT